MAWCSSCLIDHDEPCLDEQRRADVAVRREAPDGRPCPYCGGRRAPVPSRLAASPRPCAFCYGTGYVGW